MNVADVTNCELYSLTLGLRSAHHHSLPVGNGSKLRLTNCLSTEGPSGNMHVNEIWAKPHAYETAREDIWFSLSSNPAPYKSMCLDLTGGSKENRNVLQMWECAPHGQPTYMNQRWTLTAL